MLASIANHVVFAQAEGGGSFLVTPGIGLMIWTLVVFGVSMYILAKVAFPRIGEALDKRQKAIEDSIATSERIKHEAEELLDEYRQRLADARGQADDIVARARKTGEAHENEVLGVLTLPFGVLLFMFEVGLVATLQAFIFATLSAIYLGGAVAEHH